MLLGPNGAGKTTTLRMVSGLLKPDAGAISVFGIDTAARSHRGQTNHGWLSDEPMIYDKLTPLEYLEFVSGLWTVEPRIAETRSRELLGWLGLEAICERALREILARHAPEGGACGRTCARAEADHSR